MLFNALRLRFRLVASGFPGIVCILDGDRSGTVELTSGFFFREFVQARIPRSGPDDRWLPAGPGRHRAASRSYRLRFLLALRGLGLRLTFFFRSLAPSFRTGPERLPELAFAVVRW